MKRLNLGMPTDVNQLHATLLQASVMLVGAALAMEDSEVAEAAYELLRRIAAKKQAALPEAAERPEQAVSADG